MLKTGSAPSHCPRCPGSTLLASKDRPCAPKHVGFLLFWQGNIEARGSPTNQANDTTVISRVGNSSRILERFRRNGIRTRALPRCELLFQTRRQGRPEHFGPRGPPPCLRKAPP